MAQSKEALRKLRQKYGLGEYKKNRKRKVFKRRSSTVSMVKRRKARRTTRKSSFSTGIWATILGVSGYVIYEALIRPMLPVGNIGSTALSLGEIALGLWLSKKGGMLGNVGKTMVVLNAYTLVRTFIAPMIGAGTATQTTSAFNY